MMSVSARVYEIVGVKVGEVLPSLTFPGMYTILYQTKSGESICGTCANSYVNPDDPICHAGTYDEGETLVCKECHGDIESSYGPLTLRCPQWADRAVLTEEIPEKF